MLRRHGLNRNKDLTQGRGLTPWDILQFRMGFWSEAASGRPVATGQNEIREQVTTRCFDLYREADGLRESVAIVDSAAARVMAARNLSAVHDMMSL